MIPQETIDRIREATDIVETISKYCLLKQSGKSYKGLCPFHQEKTPSFIVNPDRQIFKCFGCGAGGNAYHFLMRAEGLSFLEAVRELAKRANLPLPDSSSAVEDGQDKVRRQLLEVTAWAEARFRQALTAPKFSAPAQAYLQTRGLSAELAERFGLGFAPSGWDHLLRAAQRDHYSAELLEKAGLAVPRPKGEGYYDRFRERLMFPIRDAQGRPIAFGGRILGAGEPKYLNSPETALFKKGENLYALDVARDAARKQGRLVLVEGYMDAITCHAAGVTETVASLGTALTPQQARLIRRYAERVILIYDADEAGVNAALRAFEVLRSEKLNLQVVSLPDAKDPDEYIRQFGAEAFQKLLGQAVQMVVFVLQAALKKNDANTIEGKVAVVKQVVPFIALLRDNPVEKQEYTHLLAERLRLDVAQVAQMVSRETAPRPGVSQAQAAKPAEDLAVILQPRVQTRAEEELLLGTLLQFPHLLDAVRARLQADYFIEPAFKQIAQKLAESPAVDLDADEVWLPRFLGDLPDPELAAAVAGLTAREVIATGQDFKSADRQAERVIHDCLTRLEAARLRERIQQTQWQIKEADSQGDLEMLKQLQQHEIEMKNQLKQLGVDWKPGKKA